MSKKRKVPDGFVTEIIDGEERHTKAFPDASYVEWDESGFSAFNKHGYYVGMHAECKVAEYLATKNRANVLDECSELSLWPMWNDAVDSGSRVFRDDDGRQFIYLSNDVLMCASDDKHGYSAEIVQRMDFDQEFWDKQTDCYEIDIVEDDALKLRLR